MVVWDKMYFADIIGGIISQGPFKEKTDIVAPTA
jgi:hypothetical protein